ncbi:hypothetical protein BD770DRAFT_359206 [Pilaira anomala]|nr:hypothetical protein BD770DRAFT_359206 [Pilaira anomala]
MPGPATILSLGAVGAAAVYVNRRNSMSSETEDTSPIALARRKSSTVIVDHDWPSRKQPEYMWLRDNGASFSHNSKPKFPTSQQKKAAHNLDQTSK